MIQINSKYFKSYKAHRESGTEITSRTNNFGVEGDTLELNCFHNGKLQNIEWRLPNNEPRQVCVARIPDWMQLIVWWWKLLNEKTHIFQVGKLIIENLDKSKDSGDYKCTVITNGSISTKDTLTVTILGKNPNKLNH